MQEPTTGLEPLDELIGGLRIGDNVVVQVASEEEAVPLLAGALRDAAEQDRLVYASFRDSPRTVYDRFGESWDPERFVLYDYRADVDDAEDAPADMRVVRPSEDFDAGTVGRDLLRIGMEWGPGTRYVIDSLTDVEHRWGDAAVLDLFLSTCPALYQQRTIAYWTLRRDAHSRRSLMRLEEITQVVLDVHTDGGELVVELRKAAGRPVHLRGGRIHAVVEDDRFNVVRRLVGTRERAGELVRQRREALGLSQAELARRVGITPSALSQAERGLHGLSGDVLTRVWEAMDVPFGPEASATRSALEVFRRGRASVALKSRLQVETVVDRSDLTVHVLQFPPDTSNSGAPFSTKQREFIVMLDGVLELRVGQVTETLQAGDAALVTDEPVTAWTNPGLHEARALWMLLP